VDGRKGDFSAVPLAPDFAFTGPVASFDTAEGLREMAAQAGPMVTRFSVRRQFVDDDTVCSIIDWEMAPARNRAERFAAPAASGLPGTVRG
jgi:hypothetical protein